MLKRKEPIIAHILLHICQKLIRVPKVKSIQTTGFWVRNAGSSILTNVLFKMQNVDMFDLGINGDNLLKKKNVNYIFSTF